MTASTTYVSAAEHVSRRSGQIRLHGPEDFAGMRKAGALAAEALDLHRPTVRPGVTTAALDKLAFEFALRPRRLSRRRSVIAAIASRSAPRSTTSSATAFPTTSRCATATSSTST